ncbi:unnamed protein product, partial [Meganyctiphanes norvegica]
MELVVLSSLSVSVTPPSATVDAGKTITLTCSVSGSPVKQIEWLKNGTPLQHRPNVNSRSLYNAKQLLVESLGEKDVGMYQCRAYGHHDSAVGTAVLSLGATVPVLSYRFIEQSLQPGPAVSLKCIASATPTPAITWDLDGWPLHHTDRLLLGQYVNMDGDVISHVNISSIRVSDGGLYRCKATNAIGNTVHSAHLNIYGPPMVRAMGEVTAVAGNMLVITCPVGGYPIHSITWYKEGRQLPLSLRQAVHSNGSFVISNVQRATDEGSYSCTASATHGLSSTQPVNIKVAVPPRILPFSPDNYLIEGSRLTVTCTVTEGDLPLTIAWSKDGQQLSKSATDISVDAWGDFNSHLTIAHMKSHHAGNYSCTAQNKADFATQTLSIYVNVPPRWVLEPEDASAISGTSILMPCQADGFPIPSVVWKKEGASVGSYHDFVSSVGIQQLSNGSLLLTSVKKEEQGRYLCEANNGIGAGLSKVVQINVHAPPQFSENHENVSVGTGGPATLLCPVTGDQPMKAIWYKNGLTINGNYRYSLRESSVGIGGRRVSLGSGSGGVQRVFQLVLSAVGREDGGEYTCTVTNTHGQATRTILLIVQEPPESPRNLKVIEKGSRFLQISWEAPLDGNSPITKYRLLHSQKDTSVTSGSITSKESVIGGSETSYLLKGLLPATQYVLKLFAHNALGSSKPSQNLVIFVRNEPP